MTIHLLLDKYERGIKSITFYTNDLEIKLPHKEYEKYGKNMLIIDLYNDDCDFVTIDWSHEEFSFDRVKLSKIIRKAEIKCIDIIWE